MTTRPPIPRRRFLAGGATALAGLTLARSPVARAVNRLARAEGAAAGVGGDGRLRVYTIVVDGLSPGEITPELMPQLAALSREGTRFTGAEAVMIAETLPNHVAMLTGTRGGANGVPANEVYDRELGEVRLVDRPGDITAPTVIDRARAAGLTTATVVSKQYLFDILASRADHHWEPGPQIPESDHAPDPFTMEALLGFVEDHDPDLSFVNLGDVDRSGHADPSGALAEPAFRTGVLASTDAQLRRFVTFLQDTGRWEASVLVVLADHSMDWSPPRGFINLDDALGTEAALAGRYALAQNGGADLVYYTGDPGGRAEALARMRTVITGVEGVASVTEPDAVGLGPKAGDLVAFAEEGYRFSDPDPWSNPIPGNHGHPVTLPIPFIVGGGAPLVRRGEVVEGATVSSMDAGPTVGWLFDRVGAASGVGLGATPGAVRTEAFTLDPAPAAPAPAPSGSNGGPPAATPAGDGATGAGSAGRAPAPTPATGAESVLLPGVAALGAAALARRAGSRRSGGDTPDDAPVEPAG